MLTHTKRAAAKKPVRRCLTDWECVAIAEKLAKEHGGKIPKNGWLLGNGFGFLYRRLESKPELFVHLEQYKPFATDAECVALAEELARENGGKIPSKGWLQDNHHKVLYNRMRKLPELFAHLEQECRLGMTPGDALTLAEKLTKENGGTLPYSRWLYKNGHRVLASRIESKPDLFAHLEQDYKGGI